MFGKDIPTIRPHSSSFQQTREEEAPDPDPPNPNIGKRVWMVRVKDEATLKRLVAFVVSDEGITELKPRYPYDAQKQREYRARKKAKEQIANELQSVPTPKE